MLTDPALPISVRRERVAGSLATRASNARASWCEREALLLTLTDAEGRQAQGEASPLPNYSPDTLAECELELGRPDLSARLSRLVRELTSLPDRTVADAICEKVAGLMPESLPAARFALETALSSYESSRRGLPLGQLFAAALQEPGPPSNRLASAPDWCNSSPVPLAFLVDAEDPARALKIASDHVARGARVLKLKVGRTQAWTQELNLLRELRRRFPDCAIRTDANGQLAADTPSLLARLRALAEIGVEFVEEPCAFSALPLAAAAPVAIALDESLQQLAPNEAARLAALGIRYLVLKPATLSLGTSVAWIRAARDQRLCCILSHLMGGPIELTCLAHLALASADLAMARPALTASVRPTVELPSEQLAAGLAPHAGLSIWPTLHLPLHDAAHLRVSNVPGLGLSPFEIRAKSGSASR